MRKLSPGGLLQAEGIAHIAELHGGMLTHNPPYEVTTRGHM